MNRPHRRQRRGAVLIMALVCLVLAVTIGGALLRWVVLEHKLLATRADESQTRWLAEAAVERAAARLSSDAEYSGEIWEIAADELRTGQAGRIELRIDAIEGQSRQRSITVVAEYPLDAGTPARVRKQITYQLPQEDEP